MPFHVCMGATLKCSFGAAPSKLMVLPANRVVTNHVPAANILDHNPLVNSLPFGPCSSLAFPATAAAMGALTPMPCMPNTPVPWAPGSPTVMLANVPALNQSSKLMCAFGGVIQVVQEGQTNHQIP